MWPTSANSFVQVNLRSLPFTTKPTSTIAMRTPKGTTNQGPTLHLKGYAKNKYVIVFAHTHTHFKTYISGQSFQNAPFKTHDCGCVVFLSVLHDPQTKLRFVHGSAPPCAALAMTLDPSVSVKPGSDVPFATARA